MLAETDSEGNLTKAYGFNPKAAQQGLWSTDPMWQANVVGNSLTNSTTGYHYLHTDHLATPILATDKVGSPTWKGASEAFGATKLTIQATEMNLRFPGQYWDRETNSHYNFNRDYLPGVGRYIQSDPIGLDGGVNLYPYVGGNPVSRVDPKGLFFDGGNGGDSGGNWIRCPLLKEVFLGMIWPMPLVSAWLCLYDCRRTCPGKSEDIVIRLFTIVTPPFRFGCDAAIVNPNPLF